MLMLSPATFADPSGDRQTELRNLLQHDCGSCHGLRLQGGLGPALTTGALEYQSADTLRNVILHGRPGTAMPPWQGLLDEDEVDWLVRLLKAQTDEF